MATIALFAVAGSDTSAAHPSSVRAAVVAPPQVDDVTLKRQVSALIVRWGKVNGDVRYRVQKSVSGGAWKAAGSTRRTSIRVEGLQPKMTRIRVKAVRDGRSGRWSTPVKMTPSDPAWQNRTFETVPVGSDLPSGAKCRSRVRPTPEHRSGNAARNTNRGTQNDVYPRVAGGFVGTTDEILQWVACKWGVHEDLVRAQAVVESRWYQSARGDYTTRLRHCHPSFRDARPCPVSVGIFQIGYRWHASAYEDRNAIRSTSYNADYLWNLWRDCFEGEYTWLNSVPHGRPYPTGNRVYGCVGVNNTGTWLTPEAKTYIGYVKEHRRERTWEQSDF